MPDTVLSKVLEPIARPSVTDAVFDELHRQILSLELPPGTRMSEADVARIMGVSRQPVRDAFYRLSVLGFLSIRPQRATVVSHISEQAVMQARFIRSAIEAETVRTACAVLTAADIDALSALLDQQRDAMEAGEKLLFHRLDDLFHREICDRAGLGFAWQLIAENKGHMDRVRMLSLSFASQRALDDHVGILNAIRAGDGVQAADTMRLHLSRIVEQIDRIRAANHSWFAA